VRTATNTNYADVNYVFQFVLQHMPVGLVGLLIAAIFWPPWRHGGEVNAWPRRH
jgi:hypothetical protein